MIPTGYPPKDEIARLSARMLLEVGAVHFNASTPYTHASGKQAPAMMSGTIP
jgi:orotate phosphoribosyltransferase